MDPHGMAHLRARRTVAEADVDANTSANANTAVPSWTWKVEKTHVGDSSSSGGAAAPAGSNVPTGDEDWATTTGYAPQSSRAASTLHEAKAEILRDEVLPPGDRSGASGASGMSDASDASWITEDTRRWTPTVDEDHGSDEDHEGHEDHDDRQHEQPHELTPEEEEQLRFQRHYKPRTCRICLETVLPTFEYGHAADDDGHDPLDTENAMGDGDVDGVGAGAEADAVGLGAAFGAIGDAVGDATAGFRGRVAGAVASAMPRFMRTSHLPRVRYVSENPQDGRLISPCRCKGSQKYVHEGCLQAWRHSQPLAERNFWTCPTCGFEYRIQRLRWGRLVSNRATRMLMTLLFFVLALFLLGFVADPLMDLWSDPAGVIMDSLLDFDLDDLDIDDDVFHELHEVLHHHGADGAGGIDGDEADTWLEHFIKGFFSLGIIGVVKTFLIVSPFTWWNLRGPGLGRGRRRVGGGRGSRYDNMGWVFILIGAFTFMGASWKFISYLSGRLLEHASERIVDIGSDEPDDDDDDDDDDDADAGHNAGHNAGHDAHDAHNTHDTHDAGHTGAGTDADVHADAHDENA